MSFLEIAAVLSILVIHTGYLFVIPAQAGIQAPLSWTPACAGVTVILQTTSIKYTNYYADIVLSDLI